MNLSKLNPYTPYIYAGLAAFALTTGLAIVGYIYHRGVVDAERAQRDKDIAAYQADVTKANEIAQRLEKQLAESTLREREIKEKLKHELDKDPVYRECRVPRTGVQLLQDARRGKTSSAR